MKKLLLKMLRNLEEYTKTQIFEEIQKEKTSYHISGKKIENIATDKVLDFFREDKAIKLLDFRKPKTKNEWPDLTVKIVWPAGKSEIFFEMKAADSSKNPANDLGTLRSLWKEHILKPLGVLNLDNLFMIFVKYSKEDGKITDIGKVYVAHYF